MNRLIIYIACVNYTFFKQNNDKNIQYVLFKFKAVWKSCVKCLNVCGFKAFKVNKMVFFWRLCNTSICQILSDCFNKSDVWCLQCRHSRFMVLVFIFRIPEYSDNHKNCRIGRRHYSNTKLYLTLLQNKKSFTIFYYTAQLLYLI